MSQKKEELLKEEDVSTESEETAERVVLIDEKGKELDEEQARKEEERLNSLLDNFFMNQLNQPGTMEAKELEDDEEDLTVTVNDEGDVVKEATVTKETVEKEVLMPVPAAPAEPSIFEEELLIGVIQDRIHNIDRGMREIDNVVDSFFTLVHGDTLYDNIIDAARKEKNELQSLLFVKPVSLRNLKNDELKKIIEYEVRETTRDMIQKTLQERKNK